MVLSCRWSHAWPARGDFQGAAGSAWAVCRLRISLLASAAAAGTRGCDAAPAPPSLHVLQHVRKPRDAVPGEADNV